MSTRKRTPKNPTTETSTVVSEPPVAQPPIAEAPTGQLPHTVAAPPVELPDEPKADGQTFAGKVGQKKWSPAPDPFGIAKDNLAAVRLFESKLDGQMAIKFGEGRPEDKPSQVIIDRMKEAGYRWNTKERVWTYPVTPESAMSTRIDAEKLYQEVRQMIRHEKGIEATPDMPN